MENDFLRGFFGIFHLSEPPNPADCKRILLVLFTWLLQMRKLDNRSVVCTYINPVWSIYIQGEASTDTYWSLQRAVRTPYDNTWTSSVCATSISLTLTTHMTRGSHYIQSGRQSLRYLKRASTVKKSKLWQKRIMKCDVFNEAISRWNPKAT